MELINLEKLITQASQNPELSKVVKMDEAAKAMVSNMQLPSNKLVRNPQEIAEYEQMMQQNQPQDPKMMEMQIRQQELEIEKEKIALEREKLQFEMQMGQQRAQMEFEERMEANDARIAEANSSVLKEQLKRDTAMTQYASRQQMDLAKLQAQVNIKERDQQIKEFELGIKTELDANKQSLTAEELRLKSLHGTGI
jgi:hypothetical protein